MMKLLFNGNLIEDPIPWSPADRAFLYGDGFFETMLFSKGRLPLLSNHLDRIHRAAEIFQFTLQESEFKFLEENIDTLVQLNEIETDLVRAKLIIWRRSAGQRGYRTIENHVNWSLMVFERNTPLVDSGTRLAISEESLLTKHKWSGIKTINALPYIMAGLECEKRKLDDLVLLNNDGKITECIESNIFWLQDGAWHTPSLESGCIDGTMRRWLLTNFDSSVREILVSPAQVKPEQAFTCNAAGFKTISEWAGTALEENQELLHGLLNESGLGLS